MPFPIISGGGRSSTTTQYGGQELTKIQNLFNNVNIASVDATNKPILNTELLFKSGKLRLYDSDSSNIITIVTSNISQDVNLTFPTTMLGGASVNTFLFEGTTQPISGKIIDADNNTIIDLDDANIRSTAAINWAKIAKTGSKLQDLANVYSVGLSNNQSPIWNSANNRWEMRDLTNVDILLPNKTVLPTATTTGVPIYRNDLDANNQRVYLSVLQSGSPVLVRVA